MCFVSEHPPESRRMVFECLCLVFGVFELVWRGRLNSSGGELSSNSSGEGGDIWEEELNSSGRGVEFTPDSDESELNHLLPQMNQNSTAHPPRCVRTQPPHPVEFTHRPASGREGRARNPFWTYRFLFLAEDCHARICSQCNSRNSYIGVALKRKFARTSRWDFFEFKIMRDLVESYSFFHSKLDSATKGSAHNVVCKTISSSESLVESFVDVYANWVHIMTDLFKPCSCLYSKLESVIMCGSHQITSSSIRIASGLGEIWRIRYRGHAWPKARASCFSSGIKIAKSNLCVRKIIRILFLNELVQCCNFCLRYLLQE